MERRKQYFTDAEKVLPTITGIDVLFVCGGPAGIIEDLAAVFDMLMGNEKSNFLAEGRWHLYLI